MAVLDKDHIDYTDYVDAASMIAEELKKNKGTTNINKENENT